MSTKHYRNRYHHIAPNADYSLEKWPEAKEKKHLCGLIRGNRGCNKEEKRRAVEVKGEAMLKKAGTHTSTTMRVDEIGDQKSQFRV